MPTAQLGLGLPLQKFPELGLLYFCLMFTMSCGQGPPKRVQLSKGDFEQLSREEIAEKWKCQDQFVDWLESRCQENAESSELAGLRESEEKLKQQQLEATRRENVLVMRLTTKEQEMQEYANQIQELKQAQIPTTTQLRSTLLDPAVNLLYERMRKEQENVKARLEETQNELSAWKFTPDSNTGKRLMAKCRLLYQENEELGKVIASGRMAKLEGDLALQRNFSEEMKKSQADLDEFMLELDEDVEGMQSTIYYLQQQLREAKEQIVKVSREKHQLSNLRATQTVHTNDTREARRLSTSHHPTAKVVSVPQEPNLSKLSSNAEAVAHDKVKGKFDIAIKEEQPNGYIKEEHTTDILDYSQNSLKSRLGSPVPKPDPFDIEDPHSPEDYATELVVDKTESLISLELHPSEMQLDSPDANVEPGDLSLSISLTPRHLVASTENSQDAEFPSVVSDSYASSGEDEKSEKDLKPTLIIDNIRTSNHASTENEDSSSDKADCRKRSRTLFTEHSPSEEDDTCTSPKRLRTREDSRTATQASDHTYDSSSQDLHLHSPSIDIDTDTEVQVAQTLACWAAASKERNEAHSQVLEERSVGLGNGEVDSCGGDEHS